MSAETDTSPLSTADLVTAAQAARVQRKADAQPVAPNGNAGEAALPSVDGEPLAPLFVPAQSIELRASWDAVQSGFVDDPTQAVRKADELVAQVMKSLAESFSNERARLEGLVDQTDPVSTEQLRIALRRYRSFFQRLLTL